MGATSDRSGGWESARRRRVGPLAAVAGAVAAVAVAASLLTERAEDADAVGEGDPAGPGEGRIEVEIDDAPPRSAGPGPGFDAWAEGSLDIVDEAPVQGRMGATALWTGERVLVWGGAGLEQPDEPVEEVEDLEQRTGGDLGQARAAHHAPRADHTAAWWSLRDGALWDPATGEWEAIPPAPADVGGTDAAIAWTGEELLVWGGTSPGGQNRLPWDEVDEPDGAAFDPATGTWRPLPEGPLRAPSRPAAAWTGEELWVVAGIVQFTDDRHRRVVYAAAAYDPDADDWRLLPALAQAPPEEAPTTPPPPEEQVPGEIADGLPRQATGPSDFWWHTWADEGLVLVDRTAMTWLDAEEEAWRTEVVEPEALLDGEEPGEAGPPAMLHAPAQVGDAVVVQALRRIGEVDDYGDDDRILAMVDIGVDGPVPLSGPPEIASSSTSLVAPTGDGLVVLLDAPGLQVGGWWRVEDDAWLRLPDGLIDGRQGPAMAWTGEELFVWSGLWMGGRGGIDSRVTLGDGLRWRPD